MEELVRQLERHAPDVTFGNDDVKLDEGNAGHLVAALQRVPRVTSVTFLFLKFEGLSDVVCDVMQYVTSVTALDVSFCRLDMERVAEGLRGNGHLKVLAVRISAADVQTCEPLAAALAGNTALEELVLVGSEAFVPAVARAVATTHIRVLSASCSEASFGELRDMLGSSVHLRELSLLFRVASAEGAERLAEGVAASASLEQLNVSGCELRDEGAIWLCRAIERRGRPMGLNLRDNGLSAVGVSHVARLLERNLLTKLNVSRNAVGDEGAAVLAAALPCASQLVSLHAGNLRCSTRGLQAVADGLTCRGLTELSVGNKDDIELEACRAIGRALQRVGTIRTLDFSSARVDDEGFAELMGTMDRFCSVRALSCCYNELAAGSFRAISEALRRGVRLGKLRCLRHAEIREGAEHNGWLRECNVDVVAPFIERNRAMHERAARSAQTVQLIRGRRRGTMLNRFPVELVTVVAQLVWSTRGEIEVWNVKAE